MSVSTIPAELERTSVIRQAKPTAAENRQTMLKRTTQELSRRGLVGAKCELANQALLSFVQLLYERDDDGSLANVELHTNRILLPCPWGRLGAGAWGLRGVEGRILGRIISDRAARGGLFVYDPSGRCWLLNLRAAPSLGRAVGLLQADPVMPSEWREAALAMSATWRKGATPLAGE